MGVELTVSLKILLSNQNGEYLVLQRPPSSSRNAGKWDLPGGKMHPEEPYLQELRREVWEETGLDVQADRIIGLTEAALQGRKVLTLIFQGRTSSDDVKLSHEHSAFRWVRRDQLTNLAFTDKLQEFLKESQPL